MTRTVDDAFAELQADVLRLKRDHDALLHACKELLAEADGLRPPWTEQHAITGGRALARAAIAQAGTYANA